MLYVDSSALIKRYIREAGSRALNAQLEAESLQRTGIFMSVVGYAEVLAVFGRRSRDSLLSAERSKALQEQFLDDWMFSISRVELTSGVLGFIPELVNKHPLKGSDAIHLASALSLRDALRLGKEFGQANRSITFVSADKQLNRAASAEGLEVFDPQDKN